MKSTTQKSIKKSELICIELLNSFTETELDQFTHFINCYYFNTDKSVVKLFETLRKRILHKKPFDDIQQKSAFEQVFGASNSQSTLLKKEKKHLNAKLSLLKNLAEQFLSVEGLMENRVHYNDLLLKKLLNKRQNRLLERHFNQLDKITENVRQKNVEFYELKNVIESQRLEYLFQSGLFYKNREDNLDHLNFNFDVNYLLKKLSFFITLFSFEGISIKRHDVSSYDAIQNLLVLPQNVSHSLINLNKAVVDLLKNKDKTSYERLLNFLNQYFNITSKEDMIAFYTVATNYCAQQIRLGKFDYGDLFEIYIEMDGKNLFIENKLISILKLKNIITVACRTEAFGKAEQLIEKYRYNVRKLIRDSVCNYNYGVIAFYKKAYNQALQYFIRVDTINLEYDVNCRLIILKCHYEMDEHYDERTMQIFRSANKFFKDNKQLTPQRKKSYRNFIQILIYIYKIKHRETKMQLSRVQEKLDAQEVNSDKNWLQTKMKELDTK